MIWIINLSQLNHKSFGLGPKFHQHLLNESYVQSSVHLLGKHHLARPELTF